MFQRILVPLDDSPLSDRLLEYAGAMARAFEARLTLLRAYNWSERFAMVDTPTLAVAKDEGGHEAERARIFLEEHAEPLRAQGLVVATVIVDSPPAEAIVAEARREPETLLVIGAHERGWLARLVRGSTLHDVLNDFNVPVLVVRDGA